MKITPPPVPARAQLEALEAETTDALARIEERKRAADEEAATLRDAAEARAAKLRAEELRAEMTEEDRLRADLEEVERQLPELVANARRDAEKAAVAVLEEGEARRRALLTSIHEAGERRRARQWEALAKSEGNLARARAIDADAMRSLVAREGRARRYIALAVAEFHQARRDHLLAQEAASALLRVEKAMGKASPAAGVSIPEPSLIGAGASGTLPDYVGEVTRILPEGAARFAGLEELVPLLPVFER